MGIYTERIERGAALLDELRPGWRTKVDVEALDVGDCQSCVLGQILGDYAQRGRIGLEVRADAAEHGFALSFHEVTRGGREPYVALTEEWREYIRESRVGAGA